MTTEPPSEVEPAVAAALFDLLSDETRLRIVRELYWEERSGGAGLSFSALGARIGADDTGRFNYHLGRLRGPLVEKREGRYVLTALGSAVGDFALEDPAPTAAFDASPR